MSRFRLPGLRDRTPVPDAVRALRLRRGEHRHAWAETASGGHVVVTDAGLRLLRPDGEADPLLEWVEVDRATWTAPVLRVEPAPTADGAPREAWEVELPEPGTVPRELRARVDATVVWTVRHPLNGSGQAGVRLVARRPVHGGALRWRVWPDAGVRLGDPLVRAEIEALLRSAQVTVGDTPDD